MTAEDLVAPQARSRPVERDDAAIALVEPAALEDDVAARIIAVHHFGCTHAEILLIHWSIVTAKMISAPTVNSCHSDVDAGEREAVVGRRPR